MGRIHGAISGATVVVAAMSLASATTPSRASTAGSTVKLTSKPHAISAAGASRLPRTIDAVSASFDKSLTGARWSVYKRFNRTPNVPSYGGNIQPDGAGDLVAVAANKKHTTHIFGVATDVMGSFSSVGKVVVATNPSTRRIYWWRNPFKTSPDAPQHSYVPPKGHIYETSAPNGWIETDASGHIFDVDATTGHSRSMGRPFPGEAVSVTSGPTGIVVTDTHKIAFIAYGTTKARLLDSSLIGTSTSDESNTPRCTSVSTQYAACGNRDQLLNDDYDPAMSNLFLDPLDGTKPVNVITFHPNLNDDNPLVTPAVFKKSMAWASIGSGKYGDIVVKEPHHKPTFGPRIDSVPMAAPGGFLATDSLEQSALIFDRSLHTQRVSRRGRSPVEALDLSLSAGTLAWTGDDRAKNGVTLRVHRRAITSRGAQRTIGPVKTIAKNAQRTPIAASDKYTVYGKGIPKRFTVSGKLVVVSKGTRRTINGAKTKVAPTLSGDRLLYTVSEKKVAVRNLKSGNTATYTARAAALDGNRLVIATPIPESVDQDVTITAINLADHTTQLVAPDVEMYPGWRVFVHGSVVGWWAIGDAAHHFEPMSQYRDLATPDPVATLPLDELLWSFTDSGMLIETYAHGGLNPGTFPYDYLDDVTSEKFLLQPYGSTEAAPVLTGHYVHSPPQIADGVIAWIDAHGRVEARLLGS
jgi:hypothetical protein